MNRTALYSVWWPPSGHVLRSECAGCRVLMYPIPIMRTFSGWSGGLRIRADGTEYGYNWRFCSEECVEDWKIKRLEAEWEENSRKFAAA